MQSWDRSPVALTRCSRYGLHGVRQALDDLLAPLGGMRAFVRPGERIALKPNCLLGTAPERAITTHPLIVRAVAEAVKEAGAHPVLVESPGPATMNTERALRRVFAKTGMLAMAEEVGLEVSFDTESEAVSAPGSVLVKRMEVLRALREADGVISLSKLKTHTYMTFTGAVKNLFGAVPGYGKAGFHATLADPDRFADMLLDLADVVAPRLSLMDGVVALEGDGPGTGGRPRELGVLLAGRDPVAVDVAACRLVGIDSAAVPVLRAAARRGRLSLDLTPPILGERLEDLMVSDFEWPGTAWQEGGLGRRLLLERLAKPILDAATQFRVRPAAGRCTACGICEQACPVGAIRIEGGLAVVDDSRCIRCYCCHELCPEEAVELQSTRLGRLSRAIGLR